jgi:hypothetical protein
MAMMEINQTMERPKMGRPTAYEERFVDMAYRMTLLGATIQALAEHFSVNMDTIHEWRSKHADFSDAIARGRDEADSHVAHSLYHRAKGYSHPAVKIFCTKDGEIVEGHYTEHYPPDTMAASLWLRNRRPDLWRDKQEHDVTVTGRIARLDDDERATKALQLVQGMLGKPADAIESTAIDVTPKRDEMPGASDELCQPDK